MDFVKEMQDVLGGTLSPMRVSTGHIYNCCVFIGALDGADWLLCQSRDVYMMVGSKYKSLGSLENPEVGVPQVVLEAMKKVAGAL